MKNYILSIDQGTTGSTALLIDMSSLDVVDKVNHEFRQIFPRPGLVEHNLNDIFDSVRKAVTDLIKKTNIHTDQIKHIGITNQRETVCAYDSTGRPLCNAIVWQDRRTSTYCKDRQTQYQSLKTLTGLPLDPYFSATKMSWLINNVEEVSESAKSKNLHLSTIDSFLLFKLTSGKSYKTEPSNASRTLLMNINSCKWDDQLLNFFDIPLECLPEICDSFSPFGVTEGLDFLPDGIPINCILGDQQAALFGQAGYSKGSLKTTYGTGAFIVLNTGDQLIHSSQGLLSTIAYRHQGKPCYALEGSSYIAGAAVQWLRDNLNLFHNAQDIEALAKKASDESMEHVIFLPFFTGIGSPYWNSDAKAAIVGLTRDTDKTHISRACLEGMALSINDSIQVLLSESPTLVEEIRVDGGACQNNLLMQYQSNFSDMKIVRPQIIETTAYGVALGALIGAEKLEMSQIDQLWQEEKSFTPQRKAYFLEKKGKWGNYVQKILNI